MTARFQLVPAAYVWLMRPGSHGDEILLQLRQNTGFMDGHWAAGAAGHVEQGESAYAAAQRETREELGVEVRELEFCFAMQRSNNAVGVDFDPIEERIDFFFATRSWVGEPRIVEPTKCGALEWFSLDALPEPLVPHEKYALSKLGAGDHYLSFGV